MKTVEKVVNPFRRAGEQSPGRIYNEKKPAEVMVEATIKNVCLRVSPTPS